MNKVYFFWKELMATFWFVPVLIIGLAILLSIGLVSIDNSITIAREGWIRFFLVNSAASARTVLSTISGAMISVAGTVFSVTLVALTLASSQFGPRLIKNFMYVRLNQIVLGSYISTYLYCLLVMNAIQDSQDFTSIPSLSIFAAILAAIVNIILLIIFIHTIATSIQADRVIADITDVLTKQVEILFPEKIGEDFKDEGDTEFDNIISKYPNNIPIKAVKNGYLQYIDSAVLIGIVSDNKSLLTLNRKPGSFVVVGDPIGTLHFNKDWAGEDLNSLENQFVFGKTKTAQQDLEYSIHQLVEIAARALSPGVNDPYTAIACIDNLTAILCQLACSKFPSKYRMDNDGNLRVVAKVLDFEGVVDAAFNQIRQFSVGSTAVVIRLMEGLGTILSFTKKNTDRQVILKHAKMVLNTGENFIKEENDLKELSERAEKLFNKTSL